MSLLDYILLFASFGAIAALFASIIALSIFVLRRALRRIGRMVRALARD